MDNNRIIEIVETLLDGYSPTTGESLEDNVILNDREIIRALTMIVIKLKETLPIQGESISKIDTTDFLSAVKVFESYNVNVTEHRLRKFFSGRKLSENEKINSHVLFGKYENNLTRRAISLSVKELFSNHINKWKPRKWDYITYFNEEKFNFLSFSEKELYRNLINEIGVLKNEDLSDQIINSRKHFKRAYESWSEKETKILKEVIEKTNDLDVLSEIFQRGHGGIQSQAKKIIYYKNNRE